MIKIKYDKHHDKHAILPLPGHTIADRTKLSFTDMYVHVVKIVWMYWFNPYSIISIFAGQNHGTFTRI